MKKITVIIAGGTVLLGIIAIIVLYPRITHAPHKISTHTDDTIQVLVSILPQKEMVQRIGKDRVSVTELIHPGESPATYTLTAHDLVSIEKSDLYFRIGFIPFEKAHLHKITSTNPDLTVVNIPEDIHLRHFDATTEHDHAHDDTTVDPHLWLSIDNMILYADTVAATLTHHDPEHATFYTDNATMYKEELAELKADIAQNFAQYTGKNLLVFHPAWGYLADEYGLTQIAIEHDGNDPTAEQLSAIIQKARDKNVTVLFVQSQFSTTAAENIAHALNIPVVHIDPLAEHYSENMRHIAHTIHKYIQ